jgi:Holliday junction resolvase RusA-like endonuclease
MITQTLWLPFPAVVKARPRLGRRRKAYTPQYTVDFERKVREFWHENGHHFGNVPVYVGVEIHKEGIQVTIHELEESVRPVGIKGDVDNYVKAILDGLQPHKAHPEAGLAAFVDDKMVEWFEVKFVGVPRKIPAATTRHLKLVTTEPAHRKFPDVTFYPPHYEQDAA